MNMVGVLYLPYSFIIYNVTNTIVYRVIVILSLIGAGLIIWNQYLNGPIGGNLDLWNYIDPYAIIVLLAAAFALWKSSSQG